MNENTFTAAMWCDRYFPGYKFPNDEYSPVDVYELKIGDYFFEDTYPDVYCVTGFDMDTVLASKNGTVENVEFFYDKSYPVYRPILIRLEKKND